MRIVNLIGGDYKQLSYVFRYSGSPLLRTENVAEHHFYVAFFTMMISMDLNKNGYSIDVGKAVQKALVHDLEESQSGDIIRTFKYRNPDLKRAVDDASEAALKDIIDADFPDFAEEVLSLWRDSKDDSIEGRIVAFSDLLTVISFCDEQIKLGNRYMLPIQHRALGYLRDGFGSYKTHDGKKPFASYMRELKRFELENS